MDEAVLFWSVELPVAGAVLGAALLEAAAFWSGVVELAGAAEVEAALWSLLAMVIGAAEVEALEFASLLAMVIGAAEVEALEFASGVLLVVVDGVAEADEVLGEALEAVWLFMSELEALPVAGVALEADEFDALLFWQVSEIIFTLSTLKLFIALVSGEPLSATVCPTWSLRLSVEPVSVQDLPDWSMNV